MAITGLTVGGGNVTGVSGTDARDDHEHAIPRGTPVALPVGGSNVAGTSGDFADASHKHELPPFGDGAGEFCEGNDPRLVDVANYYTKWDPDAPPASPDAADDEFDSGSLSGWTTWDPGGYLTISASTTTHAATITGVGNSFPRWGGIYKAIPNAEFAVTAKVSGYIPTIVGGNFLFGLFLGDLTTPSSGDFRSAVVRSAGVGQTVFQTANYPQWNNSSPSGSITSAARDTNYIRIRVNGTDFSPDVSDDGLTWIPIGAPITMLFTPVHVGFGFNAFTNGVTHVASCHWIRFLTGAGSSAFENQVPGRLVRIPFA